MAILTLIIVGLAAALAGGLGGGFIAKANSEKRLLEQIKINFSIKIPVFFKNSI